MPVKKGYRRPVEILRLEIGNSITDEHIAALALSEKLRQTVTARLVKSDATLDVHSITLEARPT